MVRPVIGVVPLLDIKRESLWMLPGYMDVVLSAGGLPLMLPLSDDDDVLDNAIGRCQGFLLTGGQDVDPSLYGENRLRQVTEISPLLDSMCLKLIKKALNADKPLFGICRGLQILNVALGGTLYQDLEFQTHTAVVHHQKPPYDRPSHEVLINDDTPLGRLLNKDFIKVNSYHHQGIKDLAPDLKVMALAPDDSLTEAVFLPEYRFVWAVQWHPEFSYKTDADSLDIVKAFIQAC